MQVPIHEFKSHMSKYVGQAQSGTVIELTSHRKVVAHITGVPATAQKGVMRLIACGAADWQGGKPAGANIQLGASKYPVSAMVIEDRG